ncbi:mechanosensitive ion channel [Hellea balneolensis]|uniref:mechanosensitive ion channel n=1 Tax=Hellea balneolensis TaxID=287478 RepID=UPI00041AC5EB|nr:mechanosensitive ion channel [Hellea balneolensis]
MDQLSQHLGFLPAWAVGPVIALVTIVIGYFIAKIAAAIVAGAINRTGLGKKAQTTGGNIGKSLAKAVFWVLWLVFIIAGLGQFPMVSESLAPIKGMLSNIFDYLPQLIVGAVVLAIGVMLSKVVKEALSSTLEAAQVDRLATKFGMGGSEADVASTSLARSLGGLAAAIVTIIFAVTAIGIWDIPGVSEPVSNVLNTILGYIPRIIGAAIILAVFVFIGRFVSSLAKSTLPALGVDNSLKTVAALDGDNPSFVPSNIIATVGFVGIVLMGLTAAMKALGIPELTNVFNTLLEVGGRVVLGAVIIGVGLFIANFISKIVTQTSGDLAGKIIKYATMIIVTFMGLETMQLGEGIVDTAFSYSVMAAAVAGGVGGAIAFGLGGREWAAKKLQEWMPTKTTRKK